MMSEADDRDKKVCHAMMAEQAKRAEYFSSRQVHKYPLNGTLWVE